MNLILAADENWAIGKDNDLLCHLPGDLAYFKEKTLDKIVVMGRKTLESLPKGKPLPRRKNIILTGSDIQVEGAEKVSSTEELFQLLEDRGYPSEEVFIIGGAQVYKQMLPYCEKCYITKIHKSFEADRYFEDLDRDENFILSYESDVHEENGIKYSFCIYERASDR